MLVYIKKIFESFIIGSSLPVSLITYFYIIFPTFFNKVKKKIIPFEYFWIVPLAFGIGNLIIFLLSSMSGKHFFSLFYICIGAIQGLGLSLIGRFVFNFPEKLFDLPKNKQFTVHIKAPIIYALIYISVLYPINYLFMTT